MGRSDSADSSSVTKLIVSIEKADDFGLFSRISLVETLCVWSSGSVLHGCTFRVAVEVDTFPLTRGFGFLGRVDAGVGQASVSLDLWLHLRGSLDLDLG